MDQVSDSAIRRFPVYYRQILTMHKAGIEFTSARRLEELTGIHKTQIRKDIALTGLVGVPRVGHNVQQLVQAIKTFLCWDEENRAVLIGAGNLGRAILNYPGFLEAGTKIVAAYDIDQSVCGSQVNGIKIWSLEAMDEQLQKLQANIGIISTPENRAQQAADKLMQNGVKGLWNFTQAQIIHPADVVVETVDLYRGLGVISKRISEIKFSKKNKK
ncbi:MAG: redox-sensing transcriptional repressor Rex [Candidatus Cloacimonadales bacterium]